MERIIGHIDMDAFFASIEQVKKPWLRGKPVAISGNPNGRSVIATASYEARVYGVKAGMPLGKARAICPNLVILKGNMYEYELISESLYNLFCEYSPAVEYFSIDEVFIDFSYVVKSMNSAIEIAKIIKERVFERFGLTCSIGISYNKLIAKLASKLSKPNGLLCIREDDLSKILTSLPVEKITGIGKKTQIVLKEKFGVVTVGDLQKIPLSELVNVFHSYGKFLYFAARGIDNSKIVTSIDREKPKSIGNSITLEKDTDDINEIKAVLRMLSSKVSSRMRNGGFFANVLKLTVRYEDFYTFTHEKVIPTTNSDSDIYSSAIDLFMEVFNGTSKVRLLGVSASCLTVQDDVLLFLDNDNEREKKFLAAMDKVRNRFGYDKLEYGNVNALRGDFVFREKKISGT